MRQLSRIAFTSLLALAAACGDSGLPTNGDGGGKDGPASTPDLTMPPSAPDLAMPVVEDMAVPADMTYVPGDANGVACGMATCNVGQVCCATPMGNTGAFTFMCAASCPMDGGTVPLACDGPEDCMGNPCCGQIMSMGSQPSFSGASCTMSMSDCSPMYTFQGGGVMGQTRFCHIDDDCTRDAPNSQLPNCCTATDKNGNKEHVCLSMLAAQLSQGSVTCP